MESDTAETEVLAVLLKEVVLKMNNQEKTISYYSSERIHQRRNHHHLETRALHSRWSLRTPATESL